MADDTVEILTRTRVKLSEKTPVNRKSEFGPDADSIYSEFLESAEILPPSIRPTYFSISESNIDKRDLNSTGPGATLMHILKANIGIGFLSMPNAMDDSGYVLGPICLVIMGIIATHCMTLIVSCSHHLCQQMQLPSLSYADVAELSVAYKFKTRFSGLVARYLVNGMLTLTQLGFCCTYIAFVAKNVVILLRSSHLEPIDYRIIVVAILPIFILGSYIRTLKTLAPLSSLANLSYLFSSIVILVYCCITFAEQDGIGPGVQAFSTSLLGYPLYFGNVIFAFEGIGAVLPLENKMSNPRLFQPILWGGMTIVISSYLVLGIVGYLAFGSNLENVISMNLPVLLRSPYEVFYPIATLYLTTAIISTYFIQFYVPMEIYEPVFLRRIGSPLGKLTFQILFRTCVVIFTALVPIAISNINLLIDFIGACSSTSLALIFPAAIEIVTFWGSKRYRLPFKVWVIKDILIILFGLFGAILGTGVAIYKIATA